PGWQATVDGRPSPIVTTNLLYRGVVIPAGRHEIVQRYHPVALVRGALAGAALLTATLCGALLAQRRGRLRW
ncbi:MAG: YfhO family protein, partial [Deltaproteobacteria bacterium]|nr:YfhO family protein [Deltaproteobacteria bacterium]